MLEAAILKSTLYLIRTKTWPHPTACRVQSWDSSGPTVTLWEHSPTHEQTGCCLTTAAPTTASDTPLRHDPANLRATSWQPDGEKMETVAYFIFLGSKIIAHGDCSHEIKTCLEIKRCLPLGRASLIAQLVKFPPAMWEAPVQFLGWENPLEKG